MIEIIPNDTIDMDKVAATRLTDRIRSAVDGLAALLAEAHDRKAWKAMGYRSWEAYVRAEFAMSRGRSYQLLDQSRVIEAVREAAGDLSTKVDISERTARDIKTNLPAVAAEIRARVDDGEEPAKAIADTVSATRKAERQAQPSCEALTAEIEKKDEYDEYIAALETDIAALKAENKQFDEMKVQWQQGGYEAVIAGKDEQIRVLNTRVSRESYDKDTWAKSAKYFKADAIKLGWSRDIVIDLETGEIVRGAA